MAATDSKYVHLARKKKRKEKKIQFARGRGAGIMYNAYLMIYRSRNMHGDYRVCANRSNEADGRFEQGDGEPQWAKV